MKVLTIALVVAGTAAGLFAGFLRWGLPAGRLDAELRDARGSAERLSRQVDDLQSRGQELSARLQAQQKRLERAEQDLHAEKEMNTRLHLLVGQGKK
jgi:hypothetical protein